MSPMVWGPALLTSAWMYTHPNMVQDLWDAMHNESTDGENCPDTNSDDEIDDDDDDESKSREKGDRFKEGDDAQKQYEEIEQAQRKVRQRKSNQIIDSIEKSRQRDRNTLRPEYWDNWRDKLDD